MRLKSIFLSTLFLTLPAMAQAQYASERNVTYVSRSGIVYKYAINPEGDGFYATVIFDGTKYHLVRISNLQPKQRLGNQEIIYVDASRRLVSTVYNLDASESMTSDGNGLYEFSCAKLANSNSFDTSYTICSSRFGAINPVGSVAETIFSFGLRAGTTKYFNGNELEKAINDTGLMALAPEVERVNAQAMTYIQSKLSMDLVVNDQTGTMVDAQKSRLVKIIKVKPNIVFEENPQTGSIAQQLSAVTADKLPSHFHGDPIEIKCSNAYPSVFYATIGCQETISADNLDKGIKVKSQIAVRTIRFSLFSAEPTLAEDNGLKLFLSKNWVLLKNKTNSFVQVTAISISYGDSYKILDNPFKLPPQMELGSGQELAALRGFIDTNCTYTLQQNGNGQSQPLTLSIEYVGGDGNKRTLSASKVIDLDYYLSSLK